MQPQIPSVSHFLFFFPPSSCYDVARAILEADHLTDLVRRFVLLLSAKEQRVKEKKK